MQDRFPHGPRTFEEELPAPSPRSMSAKDNKTQMNVSEASSYLGSGSNGTSATIQRKRRSVVVSDRKVRSTDVGVSGLYEVISEADLAFSPDAKVDAVTVFQVKTLQKLKKHL